MYSSDTIDNDMLNGGEVTPRFANFGPRLGAALLDFLCLLPIVGASTYFTIFSPNFTGVLVVTLASMLYKPVMEKVYGATLGKIFLKLKVVAKEGLPLSWSQAWMRYLPWLVGGIFNLYMAKLVFDLPVMEDVSGFMEYTMAMQEAQADGAISPTLSILQSVIGFIPIISAFFILGNNRRQAAHDILAETYVIHTQPKETL
ncbi:MAG: RDD family protein [Bacteroidota bacterium]